MPDDLIEQHKPASVEQSSQENIQPSHSSAGEGDLYVFISYAREDEAVAARVETFLKEAGVRVFRDTSDIRIGQDWIITIHRALRECQRIGIAAISLVDA